MTGAEDGVDPKLRSKSCNPNRDLQLDPDPELTSPHGQMREIDGTGVRDGVDPQRIQHKYESRGGSGTTGNPPHDLR